MKKLLFALALVGFAVSAQAQTEEEYPELKGTVITNSFWSNWFVGAGFDLESAFPDEVHDNHGNKHNPFYSKRFGYGGELYVGKWFVPSVGLRLRGHVGSQSRVNPDLDKIATFNVQAQVMFNFINMFWGYNPKRWYDISPYVGVGFAHHMAHSRTYFDVEGAYPYSHIGGGDWSPVFSVGLFNQFTIKKKWFIALDLYAQRMDPQLDGVSYETRTLHMRDISLGASVGVGYNLGKTGWKAAPDVAAVMAAHADAVAALNTSVDTQETENGRLAEQLKNRKPEVRERVVKEVVPATPASVFFNINSAKVASKKDLVNVQALAEQAQKDGKKIVVTGYADSRTGSPAYNQTLSEKRAATVADALVGMGVSRDNLIVEGKGGVDDIAPYSYNRRVIVKIQ